MLLKKAISKTFTFNGYVENKKVPKYVKDYIFDEEILLATYRTKNDYGIFTNRKIVLFDSNSYFGNAKKIFTIPYSSISSSEILYSNEGCELKLVLNSGRSMYMYFKRTNCVEKKRLRLLYSCLICGIDKKNAPKDHVLQLVKNEIKFSAE